MKNVKYTIGIIIDNLVVANINKDTESVQVRDLPSSRDEKVAQNVELL